MTQPAPPAPPAVTPPTTEPPKAPESPAAPAAIIGTPPEPKPGEKLTPEQEAAAAAKAPITDPTKFTEFKLPDGFEADETQMTAAKKLFAEEGLSQVQAQRMIDFHSEQLAAVADQPYQLWADTQKQWQDEVNADPEIGGKNLPAVKSTIAKALDAFGDKGVLEALSYTGAGNNPAIIRTIYKMAKALTEGKLVQGGPRAAPKSMAEAFYPDMPKKG